MLRARERKLGTDWQCYPLIFIVFVSSAFVFASSKAGAHFLLNLNVRVLHVEHTQDGLRVYLRTPMPYIVADKMGPIGADGLPEPAPFTANALEEGELVHFVSAEAFRNDPLGLGRLAEEGYSVVFEGGRATGQVEAVSLYRVGNEPDFATLNEAKAALSQTAFPEMQSRPLYVGDAIVDIAIFYPSKKSVNIYSIRSLLNPLLPGQEDTANLIIDYGPGSPKVFRSRGLMATPVEVSRSAISAMATFVWEGGRHILEGIDHVLFVICLVIGASSLYGLLWRVTGFTVGHSITLALGFFGYVPSGAWFVPAIETGIALSIIYAAVIALTPTADNGGQERRAFVVTLAIGLLHGLGFSFVLQEILQISSPNIWQSLLAFNFGVELGQVAIVLPVWLFFHLVRNHAPTLWRLSRIGVLGGCIIVAGYWTVERGVSLIAALFLPDQRIETVERNVNSTRVSQLTKGDA